VTGVERNWAGNHVYGARSIARPGSVDELQELVRSSRRLRALGSRHTFTALPDTDGTLVTLEQLPADVKVDAQRQVVEVGAAVTYGALARELQRQGWALANLASLPHISVAGSIATGTHGSGRSNGSLAAAVRALEVVGRDGELQVITAQDDDFAGSVVALGALGVVTRVTLAVQPSFDLRQGVFVDLPWETAVDELDAVMSAAYSVSLFTSWRGDDVSQAWVKSREPLPTSFFGAARQSGPLHMLAGADVAAATDQSGEPGPWLERLPHFRMDFTPSRGEELQSEYLLPWEHGPEAIRRLRTLGDALAPILQVGEIRAVAADDLWLSGAQGRPTIAFHFTWVRDEPAVHAVLHRVEDALTDLSPRPHWGKCFRMGHKQLAEVYPRLGDFTRLRDRRGPGRPFSNAVVDRLLGESEG
jgi:xylitol oxidase